MATMMRSRQAMGIQLNIGDVTALMVAVFVFSIPFDEIVTIPGIGSPTRLLGLIALPIGVSALVGQGRVRLRHPQVFLALTAIFVLWNLVTFFWSYQPSATIREGMRYAQLLAFVWLMSEFCRGRAKRLSLMQAFVMGNYVAFGLTAFTVLGGSGAGFRDTGPFNANQFSIILSLGIPMAALLMTERRPALLHMLNVAYPLIATFGVVLGASRSGLIVCLIALAVVPFSITRLSLLRRVLLLVAALTAVWFSFGLAPRVFPDLFENVERLQTTGDELAGGTLTGRTIIWRETLRVFEASPVVGVGSGSARFALADSALGKPVAIHNAYLSVAASTGLIGLAMFLGLLGLAAASALLALPVHRPFMLVLFVALLVAMMPANSESRKDTWFILGLLAIQRPIVLSVDASPRSSG